MADYVPDEIIDIIISYGAAGNNARAAAIHYANRFPLRRHPNHATILDLLRRGRGGFLHRQRRNRRYDDPDDPEILTVLGMVFMNPHISQRRICRTLNMTYGTVNRILKANHFHAYHISLHQALTENDAQGRVRFCRWAQEQIVRDRQFFNRVMFSDEATFKNDRTINRHNCHYYSRTQPYYVREIDYQHRWSLNVWCGILDGQLIGPHFFEGNFVDATSGIVNFFPNLLTAT